MKTVIRRLRAALLRLLEIMTAAALLLLLAPLAAVIAICVKLDSPGPVIFQHIRTGKGAKVFSILKFRTMYTDSHPLHNVTDRIDPRITRVGRFLRRTHLDEIPQFINVLRGDMAFIGPRPYQPWLLAKYARSVSGVLLIPTRRPGMTGHTQVEYQRSIPLGDFPARFAAEVQYVKNRSLAGDIKILFKTIRAVVLGNGL